MGVTAREHYAQAGKQIATEPLPENTAYLVEWFWELNLTRQPDAGLVPIAYIEISAWASLHGRTLTRFEILTLKAMETAFLAELSKRPNE